jgi:hypothetical protein
MPESAESRRLGGNIIGFSAPGSSREMNPSHRHAQSLPDVAGFGAPHPDARAAGAADTVPGAFERARLVVHLVEALDSAHMESGLLNLLRHLPAERYRHTIVCLRDQGD